MRQGSGVMTNSGTLIASPPVDDSVAALKKEPSRGPLESSTESTTMAHKVRTYVNLLQQIHNDLRLQHPEWIQPNGESPMCDSYEARLIELVDTSIRRRPNVPIAAPDRGLEYGTKPNRDRHKSELKRLARPHRTAHAVNQIANSNRSRDSAYWRDPNGSEDGYVLMSPELKAMTVEGARAAIKESTAVGSHRAVWVDPATGKLMQSTYREGQYSPACETQHVACVLRFQYARTPPVLNPP